MLKLLANENLPRQLVAALRSRGHDVRWVLEEQRGIADPVVLREALAEQRVLLTGDKDFGDLVFREGRDASCGVILMRVHGTTSQTELTGIVLPVLESHETDWPGHFAVIERKRVRIRPLPERSNP